GGEGNGAEKGATRLGPPPSNLASGGCKPPGKAQYRGVYTPRSPKDRAQYRGVYTPRSPKAVRAPGLRYSASDPSKNQSKVKQARRASPAGPDVLRFRRTPIAAGLREAPNGCTAPPVSGEKFTGGGGMFSRRINL